MSSWSLKNFRKSRITPLIAVLMLGYFMVYGAYLKITPDYSEVGSAIHQLQSINAFIANYLLSGVIGILVACLAYAAGLPRKEKVCD